MIKLIAEISANHCGSKDRLLRMVKAAKDAGCWAVKLQLFEPDDLAIDNGYIIPDGKWAGRELYQLYKEAQTPKEWHKEAFKLANEIGIKIFSSPFSVSGVEFLESIGCEMFKVASGEITHKAMLEAIAATKKPVFISTGLATNIMLDSAFNLFDRRKVVLMKCTSEYPTPIENANLSMIRVLKKMYHTEVGLSDHSRDELVALSAVAYGATYIEKHMMMPATSPLDAGFSLTPAGLEHLNERLQDAEKIMGQAGFDGVNDTNRLCLKSIWVRKAIKAGEIITEDNIVLARPGTGMTAWLYESALGRVAKCDIPANTPLSSREHLT